MLLGFRARDWCCHLCCHIAIAIGTESFPESFCARLKKGKTLGRSVEERILIGFYGNNTNDRKSFQTKQNGGESFPAGLKYRSQVRSQVRLQVRSKVRSGQAEVPWVINASAFSSSKPIVFNSGNSKDGMFFFVLQFCSYRTLAIISNNSKYLGRIIRS